jgi:hypothetical protein
MKSIIGYLMLYNCAIMVDRTTYSDISKCVKESPGASM